MSGNAQLSSRVSKSSEQYYLKNRCSDLSTLETSNCADKPEVSKLLMAEQNKG